MCGLSLFAAALYKDAATTGIGRIHRFYLNFRANLQIADTCATRNVAKNSR
jgi:hypothetical protein